MKGAYLDEVDLAQLEHVALEQQLTREIWTRTEDLVAAGRADDRPHHR